MRLKWAGRKQLTQERNEHIVMASKKGTRKGTLEEMGAIESCIRK